MSEQLEIPTTSTDEPTLEDARAWLRERLDVGAHCPCCTQYAQVYKRKLNRSMIGVLAALYAAGAEHDYRHAADECRLRGVRQQGDAGKLAYWELVSPDPERREDRGSSGWWRVTARGVEFLRGRELVPRFAHVYDGRRLRYSGELVSVREVAPLFRFDELMSGV